MFIFLLHVARHEKVWGKIKTKLPKLMKVYSNLCYLYCPQYLCHLAIYRYPIYLPGYTNTTKNIILIPTCMVVDYSGVQILDA